MGRQVPAPGRHGHAALQRADAGQPAVGLRRPDPVLGQRADRTRRHPPAGRLARCAGAGRGHLRRQPPRAGMALARRHHQRSGDRPPQAQALPRLPDERGLLPGRADAVAGGRRAHPRPQQGPAQPRRFRPRLLRKERWPVGTPGHLHLRGCRRHAGTGAAHRRLDAVPARPAGTPDRPDRRHRGRGLEAGLQRQAQRLLPRADEGPWRQFHLLAGHDARRQRPRRRSALGQPGIRRRPRQRHAGAGGQRPAIQRRRAGRSGACGKGRQAADPPAGQGDGRLPQPEHRLPRRPALSGVAAHRGHDRLPDADLQREEVRLSRACARKAFYKASVSPYRSDGSRDRFYR
ncbi:hypothetical protein STPYR_12405 [uncultured Stenotrophomonas sp.]|uniref:Uncharacterized protein n=1 Tax=uncultured Stenotrophomonas sp. TaxID=165438 RepID=A0A1Y5Q5B1_9GAMM|nr:hypothetical protein STPYR_12405 [uncultured Stenotrophomonas sp.]